MPALLCFRCPWRALAHIEFGVGAIEIDDDPKKWQGAEERRVAIRGERELDR